jgi:hypothetical protein
LFFGFFDRQTAHLQVRIGTPVEVPQPRKVIEIERAIKSL